MPTMNNRKIMVEFKNIVASMYFFLLTCQRFAFIDLSNYLSYPNKIGKGNTLYCANCHCCESTSLNQHATLLSPNNESKLSVLL
jgi:hypothetical protein